MCTYIFRLAIVPILFLTLLFTSSCEKDDKDHTEQHGYRVHISAPQNMIIAYDITDVKTGWLHNYMLCNDLASATYNQGEFDIYLPETVADEYLWNISEDMDFERTPDVVLDRDAKWVIIDCFRGYIGSEGTYNALGCHFFGGKICFIYADKNVELNGTATVGLSTLYEWTGVKLNKGWNRVVYTLDAPPILMEGSILTYRFSPFHPGSKTIWKWDIILSDNECVLNRWCYKGVEAPTL